MKNAFLILSVFLLGACTERTDRAKAAAAPAQEQVETVQLRDVEIGDAIRNNADISNFAEALEASGLISTLLNQGPLTLFVPTNDAFNEYGRDDFLDLLKPENNEDLRELIKLHVVPGKILAKDFRTGELTTLEGDDIDVDVDSSGNVTVEGADIIRVIEGQNGIIYVINTVFES